MIAAALAASALFSIKPAFGANILYLKCNMTDIWTQADNHHTHHSGFYWAMSVDLDNNLIRITEGADMVGPCPVDISAQTISGDCKLDHVRINFSINRITGYYEHNSYHIGTPLPAPLSNDVPTTIWTDTCARATPQF
jgi:hypothetical protein